MATNKPSSSTSDYLLSISLIGILFFLFGFVTWLNGTLIPYLKLACQLNNSESMLVAFAFYISYFLMALPSSYILKFIGFKKGMMLGIWVMALGCLLFIPAANTRIYGLFLAGLFMIGTGLSILQTASNPYVTILGPIESAAKRISIMGICNKVAGVIAPLILGFFLFKDFDKLQASLPFMDEVTKTAALNELAARVVVPYIIMSIFLFILGLLVNFSGLPEIDTEHENEEVAALNANKTSIFQFPHLWLGVIALFFYVGVEVIAGDTIILYGQSLGIEMSIAKAFTSLTLASMIVGYFIGIFFIPKYMSQANALKFSAIIGIVLTILAIYTNGFVSIAFIALLGLANALVWPAIWPLALDGLGRFTKTASALLIMAIAGGATLPLLYGKLADIFNKQQAYWIAIPCYLVILYYAIWGHKIKSK
ncbi:MAG: sugar MFS transporter [Bacteroidales bacterium]